jgi:hypothetical protein
MSKIQPMGVGAYDMVAPTKRVFFRPSTASDTIKEGQAVCYNSDLAADAKERTSHPNNGHLNGDNATTYAEGSQTYTARLFVVEKPSSSNKFHYAGIVKALGPKAGADGDMIEIWLPMAGTIIPVYTDASCTINVTCLGIAEDAYTISQVTGDGDPLPIGVAVETVDRSNTNGLVWMRQFGQVGIGVETAYFMPCNYRNGRAYGLTIDGSNFFQGAAGAQEYLVQITGDKETAASGDCYAGYLFLKGNNYAANPSTMYFRGINANVANRDGGEVGYLTHNISVSTKSGSTTGSAIGLQIDCQHQSADNPDLLCGLDVSLNYEGGEATEEYGIMVRTRGTIQVAVDSVFRIEKGTDYGFTNLFSVDAASTIGMTSSDGGVSTHKIPFDDNGTTRYIMVSDG